MPLIQYIDWWLIPLSALFCGCQFLLVMEARVPRKEQLFLVGKLTILVNLDCSLAHLPHVGF